MSEDGRIEIVGRYKGRSQIFLHAHSRRKELTEDHIDMIIRGKRFVCDRSGPGARNLLKMLTSVRWHEYR